MRTIKKDAANAAVFQLDYGFKPTELPLLDFHDHYRDPIVSGSLYLFVDRTGKRYFYGVTRAVAIRDPQETPKAIGPAPSACNTEVFKLVDESPELTSFGAPAWSRYTVDRRKYLKALRRCAQAQETATWFNSQSLTAAKPVDQLSVAALAVLSEGQFNTIWMYRSLANPVLELVRAGHGRVTTRGVFVGQIESVDAAVALRRARRITPTWTKPPRIQAQEVAHFSNPKLRYTTCRAAEMRYGMA